jgi:hypothetical protein
MTAFTVRDLTINIAHAPAAREDGCDGSTIACFNAASALPPPAFLSKDVICDDATIACFNAESIHPPTALELIAAVTCDDATVACFNAASVHPSEIIRAVVPSSAASGELPALKAELQAALARMEPGGAS